MPACPKCGFAEASALSCPKCKTTFARPLVIDEPGAPVVSAALNKELNLDRRGPGRPASAPAAAAAPAPKAAAEPAWAQNAAPRPPAAAAPRAAPPAQAPVPAAKAPEAAWLASPVDGAATELAEEEFEEIPAEAAPAPVAAAPAPIARSAAAASDEVEEIHAEPAGAIAQIGAWIVDAAVLGGLFALYLVAAQAIAGAVPPSQETGLDWLVDRAFAWKGILLPGVALLAALSFVYSSLFHGLGGRTLGKRLFGLRLVDSTGLPPHLTRCAIRSLLSLVSAGVLMMGFALVLFDRRRQSLHDKLTRTFVVRLAS